MHMVAYLLLVWLQQLRQKKPHTHVCTHADCFSFSAIFYLLVLKTANFLLRVYNAKKQCHQFGMQKDISFLYLPISPLRPREVFMQRDKDMK